MADNFADNPFAKYITPASVGSTEVAQAERAPGDFSSNPFAKYVTGDVGQGESFLRGIGEGSTFGYEKKIGLSEEAREESKRANPWTHLAGEATGSLIPMALATLLPTGVGQAGAAARGVSLLNRAGQLARKALVPAGEIRNVGQSIGQGMKVGTVYGGLSGSGHADVKDEDTLGEALGKRALGTVKGAAFGAPTGGALGAAGHGLSRLVGAAVNLRYPELKQVMESAGSWELQGIRDVVRNAGYDKYGMADFEALKRNLADPAQTHLYQGLNLIEALEMTRVKPMPGTGELMVEPKVSPNLGWMAQENANTGGAGAQQAGQAFAARKQALSSAMQADIDATFGKETPSLGNALAQNVGRARNTPSKAEDIESLPSLIDTRFGSANRAADAEAMEAQRAQLGKSYGKLKKKPKELFDEDSQLNKMAERFPELRKAIDESLKNDLIRQAQAALEKPQDSAAMQQMWGSGELGQRIMSPTELLDVHHALVMNAKPRVGGDAYAERMSGQLKNWYSRFIDRRLKGHEDLREQYSIYKQMVEADGLGASMPLIGGQKTESVQFINQLVQEQRQALAEMARLGQGYDRNMTRWLGNVVANDVRAVADPRVAEANWNALVAQPQNRRIIEAALPRLTGDWAVDATAFANAASAVGRPLKNPPAYTDIASAYRAHGQRQQVIESFRRSWGEALREQFANAGSGNFGKADKMVRDALTPEGQRRLIQVLGEQDGPALIRDLMQIEARNQGRALGLLRGGQDSQSLAFFQRAVNAGDTDTADAFRRAWGDAIKQELANTGKGGPTRVVDDLLTQEGKARILQVLGRDDGTRYIESLYNKRQALGLSQRLWGGPDTAYKFNRLGISKSLGDAAYGLIHWQPERVLQGLKTLGSAAYQQKRADQGNSLLSQQGPEKVTAIIDAILARNQLITSGQPYVLNPTLRAAGPYIGTVPGQGQLPWDSPPQRPGQRRSQTPTTRVIDASKPGSFRIP